MIPRNPIGEDSISASRCMRSPYPYSLDVQVSSGCPDILQAAPCESSVCNILQNTTKAMESSDERHSVQQDRQSPATSSKYNGLFARSPPPNCWSTATPSIGEHLRIFAPQSQLTGAFVAKGGGVPSQHSNHPYGQQTELYEATRLGLGGLYHGDSIFM